MGECTSFLVTTNQGPLLGCTRSGGIVGIKRELKERKEERKKVEKKAVARTLALSKRCTIGQGLRVQKECY